MSVPDYASHLNQETYEHWVRYWPHFGGWNENNDPNLPRYYLKEITTPNDAAAFLMIAATGNDEPEGNSWSKHQVALHNGGRDIGSVAALIEYQSELAAEGMDVVLEHYLDPEEHGLDAWHFLAKASDHFVHRGVKHEKWTDLTITGFLVTATELIDMGRVAQGYEGHEFTPEREIFSSALGHALRYAQRDGILSSDVEIIGSQATGLVEEYLLSLTRGQKPLHADQFSWEVLSVIDVFGDDKMKRTYHDLLATIAGLNIASDSIVREELVEAKYDWLTPIIPDLASGNDSLGSGP